MFSNLRSKICILAAALLLCLSWSVLFAEKSSAEEGTVRVLLSIESASKLSMSVKGAYTVLETGSVIENGTISFSADGRTVSVQHNKLGELYSGRSITLVRKDTDPSAGFMTFKVTGYTRSYLGDFIITASGGNITVVNEVPLTQYLYGVVGYEMSNTWPVEALKAQTVAAKNYVLAKKGAGGFYDVRDTAADQVYKGYFSSLKNVISAVNESAGFGLYLDGMLIPCYYSASNGGYTILPSANWGETVFDAAYTEGTDPFDIRNTASRTEALYIPQNLARRSFSSAALYRFVTERLNAAAMEAGALSEGRAFDSLVGIDSILSTNASGIATPDGNHTRIVMNAKILTKPDPAAVQPKPTPSPVQVNEERTEIGRKSSEVREEMISVSIPFSEMADAGLFQDKSLRIYHVLPADGGWILFHGRYGHGVGMSQRGAQQMAREGWTFDRILNFYYPGAELLKDGDTGTQGQVPFSLPATPPPVPERTLDEKNNATVERTAVLYSGAGTGTPAVETLQKGDRVQATAISGEWYLVRDNQNNKVGYIFYENLTVSGEKGLAAGIITGSSVNMRSGPGTDFESIGRLDKNERVEVLAIGDSWHRVRSSTGASGYVSKEYVAVTGMISNASANQTENDQEVPGQVVIKIAPTPSPAKQKAGETITEGTVASSAAVLRTGPSESSSVLGKYERGIKFRIRLKIGNWYHVALEATGQTGYVYAKHIALGAEDENALTGGAEARIAETDTPLRSGPANMYNCIARLDRNTRVTVIGSSGSWYQVLTSDTGETGFVFGQYLSFDGQEKKTGNTGDRRQGTVLISVLEMKDIPDAEKGKTLCRIRRGYTVTVRGISGGWAQISFNGTEGYCMARYLGLK